ncbi:MAG: NAD(+) synthase [Proteobacteria bacterium]|nr:NAD(+) synthase [Pseudomonadota bacterium]
MKLVNVAACVMNQTPFDWHGNEDRIRNVLKAARAKNVSILCLPELAVSGYGCEDAFHMPHLQDQSWKMLVTLLPDTKDMLVAIGLPVTHRGALFNVIAVVANTKIVAIIPKKLLAGDGVHYEPRWFKPWPADVIETFDRDGFSVPIGDVYIDAGGVRLGFEICEEAWVANRPGANLARKGIDIILNPSASHFAFGKREIRERFVSEGSRAFNVAYLYSNLLGNESGRVIFDGGALVASEGKLIARGKRFSWKDFELTTAVVDIDINRMNKTRSGSFQPLLGEKDTSGVDVDFVWPDVATAKTIKAEIIAWENSSELKAEELSRAVALGLFDFLRKSHVHGFTVSMSGGVDSSAVALLSTYAFRFALDEIGMAGIKERLGFIPEIHKCHDIKEICQLLIQSVYQATSNSSDETRSAASQVAAELGTRHFEWNIENLVESYKDVVGKASGTVWDWSKHDLCLQNIQARVRSPGVWMLANLRNHLLLATSNRSEVAVGYATMDGDTSGGLSPLAGIDKAYLRRWLVWAETVGPVQIGPTKSLKLVNGMPPTAELRPKSQHQTDEGDLMPYDILDAIEREAIKDKKSPEEVLEFMAANHPEYSGDQLKVWIKRFFTLWCRNQWKRERYAPGFHLDELSLDPKTWCRFPILSGGFISELEAMEHHKV